MVEVLITPRSVGTTLFFREARNLAIFSCVAIDGILVVLVADALTVSFLPLSSTMIHGVSKKF